MFMYAHDSKVSLLCVVFHTVHCQNTSVVLTLLRLPELQVSTRRIPLKDLITAGVSPVGHLTSGTKGLATFTLLCEHSVVQW